ncbi:MAG: UbiA family prenyltransferase [Verrucomicrobiaceae bacterium]|nr:UbiA family prenyltransferase [Verrucomicrobiaceae bacterium]
MPPPENAAATPPVITQRGGSAGIGTWLRALRWKQWTKNVLVFLPLLFSHQWTQPALFGRAVLAFAVFCAGASAIYLVNDIMDVAADREHPEKKHRPLAAGLVSRQACWAMSALLVVAGTGAALALLPRQFFAVYLIYGVATTAYSAGLKKVVMLDALMLAGFYTLRIFAGSLATQTPVSKWLLLFSMFFFLGLAFQKRLAELRGWECDESPLHRRGYVKGDLDHILSMGTSASYMAVLVLALYIQSPDVTAHYSRPGVLWWTLPCLLYWLSRLWLLAGRQEVSEDAIDFAIKDRISYAVAAAVVIIMLLARPI